MFCGWVQATTETDAAQKGDGGLIGDANFTQQTADCDVHPISTLDVLRFLSHYHIQSCAAMTYFFKVSITAYIPSL